MHHADIIHHNDTLQEKLRHLYTLRVGPTVDLTIRPDYMTLLARLGNPHLHLPPVIHVAGTNGKGSVIACLRAIFTEAGYRVHAYTSPHLLRFNERIVLAGREIDDETLESLLDETVALNDGLRLTFFEITTALAFAAFARTPADVVLLETGLGGRLDSTNVIANPALTILMPIGDDHRDYLGDTLEQIATEKAGIMKRVTPCVIAGQNDPSVDAVFEATAARLLCPLLRQGHEWDIKRDGDSIKMQIGPDELILPLPGLKGLHQASNCAASAVAALNLRGRFTLPEKAIKEGIKNAVWPGRMQRIVSPHLMKMLRRDAELWFDGAHNRHASEALARQAMAWRQEDGKSLCLVVGMLNRRDPVHVLEPLKGHADVIVTVPVAREPECHDPAVMARLLAESGWNAVAAASIPDALSLLTARCAGPLRILACGSLYLYADIAD